ncbi:hypothetical protein [Thiomicrospira sp. ALE5]|uniref:hypothetical protein n=1 Tax=Thiomicrospira sp. ALE5 TaxID=748650 RepID=UPI0008E737A9|nr:hypothetical protein [Thiomicrospira sp. ALE5]SFR52277.1 hypothetical protein SAMN03092900_0655 [Thiomicrospira sp. ALE5]
MSFFKFKVSLAWFDGREFSLVDKLTSDSKPLVVLLSSDESCQWQMRPKLPLWQAWFWSRALVRRARFSHKDSANSRFYAQPIMRRWQGQAVYLQQQWEPHQADLSNLNGQHGIGLYGFNQWWQAWWPQSAIQSLLVKLSKPDWVMVHLEWAPKRWVQFAHYQQQACWWRVINQRDAINWSFEDQRFVDYLQQQSLQPAQGPACLICIDQNGYRVVSNADSEAAAEFSVAAHAVPHGCAFDDSKVLTRLKRVKPIYALAPWFQYYLTRLRRRRLIKLNGLLATWLTLWLAALFAFDSFGLTHVLMGHQTQPPIVQPVPLQPSLTQLQQQQITSELLAIKQRYQAWQSQSQSMHELSEAMWQQLTDYGMGVQKLQWTWQPAGYWEWQVEAELAGSQRYQLTKILDHFAYQQSLTGRLEQWRVDLQGLEVELGRLHDPQQSRITVSWAWQLWP